MHFDSDNNAYEMEYNLNRIYFGKGYATEAAKGMIQWAYDFLDAHDFAAKYAIVNKVSGNVIRKCGFGFERLD